MAFVNVRNVFVHGNSAPFNTEIRFEITFEVAADLGESIEWQATWVGSAASSADNQILDSVDIGPLRSGVFYIAFVVPAPDVQRIPTAQLLGMTIVRLQGRFRGQEFVRIGYYVQTEYDTKELNSDPPPVPALDHLVRTIVADQPRVTRFQIKWTTPSTQEANETGVLAAEVEAAAVQDAAATPAATLGHREGIVGHSRQVCLGFAHFGCSAAPAASGVAALDSVVQPVPFSLDVDSGCSAAPAASGAGFDDGKRARHVSVT